MNARLFVLLAFGIASSPSISAVYKCNVDGAMTFSQTPCAADVAPSQIEPLGWPVDCFKGEGCLVSIGYPDIDGDGRASDCNAPGYRGHEGTDISISASATEKGTKVLAAADGVVLWTFDGKSTVPISGKRLSGTPLSTNPGIADGYRVCTPLGNDCKNGVGKCFWCFFGGNLVVITHDSSSGIFASRYDHLRKDSILVKPGDHVRKGQVIGLVGSAGRSTAPHLHFEIWRSTYYDDFDPWPGKCSRASAPFWRFPAGGPTRQ